jgi:hypothetical protein
MFASIITCCDFKKWEKRGFVKRVLAVGIISLGSLVGSANATDVFGRLDIYNSVGDNRFGGYACKLLQVDYYADVSDGIDVHDRIFGGILFNPDGLGTKIISKIPSYELMGDYRPADSKAIVYLELSLISQNGHPMTVSCWNKLNFDLFVYGSGSSWYNNKFGDNPITIQQYDPCNPNACYPEYDVRKAINLNGGDIPLPDLNGTYNSEEPYAWFRLFFDRYHTDLNDDQKANFEDFAIFANAWQGPGITLADRQNPADLGAYADYDMNGNVDANDLWIFAERWLWDANDPNTLG